MKFQLVKDDDIFQSSRYLLYVKWLFFWRLIGVFEYSGGVDDFEELLRKVKIRAHEYKYPVAEFEL